jgi:RNA polymerase sigma factor (sigma-70 family)
VQRQLASILQHLRRVVVQRTDGGLSDAQLLERFVRQRDEAAFEVLVWRHGPMVLGVARRMLGNIHDAEDVLQASFLALVRQAGSISRRESVGAWLYQVAYRTALRARVQQRKRTTEPLETTPELAAPAARAESEALVLLDEELQRLPAKYRTPMVLSYLKGLTNHEIAAELACPIGTVFTRLARGREMLRLRLLRRGVTLSSGVLAAILAQAASAAALSMELARITVQAAVASAAGSTAAVAPHVAALTEGVLKMMWLSKLKLVAGVLLMAAVAGSGAGLLTFAAGRERDESKKIAVADDKPADEPHRPAREALRYGGKSFEEWRNVLLTELKPESRAEALKAMGTFGANGYPREAAAAVVQVLRGYDPPPGDEGDNKVLDAAFLALLKIGFDATPALVEELAKGNRRSRIHVLSVLPNLRTQDKDVVPAVIKDMLPAVIKATEGGEPTVRIQALQSLYYIDSANAPVAVFAKAAGDKNPEVRVEAMRWLAEMGPKAQEALPQLLKAAADVEKKYPQIRVQALDVLGKLDLDAQKVVPILIKALRDDSSEVQMAALGPVTKLGPEAKDLAVRVAELLKKAKKPEDKITIVRALARIGPTDRALQPELVKMLQDELSAASKGQQFPVATFPGSELQEELKQTLEKIKK